jgi:hypothetical protein
LGVPAAGHQGVPDVLGLAMENLNIGVVGGGMQASPMQATEGSAAA